MNFSLQTSQPAPVQSLLKINTGSLLDSLDTETQARVLEQRFIRQPLVEGKTLFARGIQIALEEVSYFDMELGQFIRTKIIRGGRTKLGVMGCYSSTNGRMRIGIKKYKFYQSHLIYLWFIGNLPKTGEELDHINGDITNDHPANLRIVSHTLNCRNLKMNKNNSSGYAGVSYNIRTGKYASRVIVNQKQIWLGSFNSASDAHAARQEWLNAHPELGFTVRNVILK
jgi:hypothetical protein